MKRGLPMHDGLSHDGLFLWCRAGFEAELAAEMGERAAEAGLPGYARTQRGSGYVEFLGADADAVSQALPFDRLIFARQKLLRIADLRGFGGDGPGGAGARRDRITPLLDALSAAAGDSVRQAFGELWIEHPDSDEGKPLAGLARSFGNALRPALREAGWLTRNDDDRRPRLHVIFLAGDHAVLASGNPRDGSLWPLGIPRLRMHADAPSRSALKLEEALFTLIDDEERGKVLREDLRAADLGAAPGGWTWVLMRNGLRVISIDNGPLRPQLLESGRVEHLRADGFHWHPKAPLDWMVCDMVEQPRRVAERMATWFREGWCKRAIFNLKLPMKKRWDETRLCLEIFERQAEKPLRVRAKQLYHDREEITVYAAPET